jgi:hypothetical protein
MTTKDKIAAVTAGWQAECALQLRATHLAFSFQLSAADAKDLPNSVEGCIEAGRARLRGHLERVRPRGPSSVVEPLIAGITGRGGAARIACACGEVYRTSPPFVCSSCGHACTKDSGCTASPPESEAR